MITPSGALYFTSAFTWDASCGPTQGWIDVSPDRRAASAEVFLSRSRCYRLRSRYGAVRIFFALWDAGGLVVLEFQHGEIDVAVGQMKTLPGLLFAILGDRILLCRTVRFSSGS
jgi:hypothetical protein